MSEFRNFRADHTLRDGRAVTIRAVRPDDRPRIAAAFRGLDRDSVYTRFFSFKSELTDRELAPVATMDFVREAMLVVTIGAGSDEAVIASARYVGDDAPEARTSAEVAFTVTEAVRGQGIASQLLRHLATIARAAGLAEFHAEVLPENRAMLAVFERSGLPMTRRREDGVVRIVLRLS